MSSEIDVLHDRQLIGRVFLDAGGDWVFHYVDEGPDPAGQSNYLSLRFPPRLRSYRGSEVAAWFRSLLPGGDIKRSLSRNLGLSEDNDFALLAAIAGDCPGAIGLVDPIHRLDRSAEFRTLSEADWHHLLAVLPSFPLLSNVEGARFTLPGTHHKIPVRVVDGQIVLPFGAALSSHIAKPPRDDLSESIMNEGYCMAMAQAVGLPVVNVQVRHGATTVLLSERYDRVTVNEEWRALPTEDFNQLFAVPPDLQYEREGGLRAADCADVIRTYSIMPAKDLRTFLRWTVFCYLFGIGSANGKTLKIVCDDKGPRLAPFTGLLSTHVYPTLNARLAFGVGGEDRPDWLIPQRWREFADAVMVKPGYVLELLAETAAVTASELAATAERFQAENGFSAIIRKIRVLVETRIRQTLVALEAERNTRSSQTASG